MAVALSKDDLDVDLEQVLLEIHECTQNNISPSTFAAAPLALRRGVKFSYTVPSEDATSSYPTPVEPAPEKKVEPAPAPVADDAQSTALNLALEHFAVATLVGVVAQYASSGPLLLSDFGSLLPGEVRVSVKTTLGGLRALLSRHRDVFELAGEPGKERVALARRSREWEPVRAGTPLRSAASRRSSRESDATWPRTPTVFSGSSRHRRSSRDSVATHTETPRMLGRACVRRSSRDAPAPTLRLRGLPFSATEEEVRAWMLESGVESGDLALVYTRDGRATGFATVAYTPEQYAEANRAQEKLHLRPLGGRYIEVFLKLASRVVGRESLASTASTEADDASFASSCSEDVLEERAVDEIRIFLQGSPRPVLLSLLGVAAGEAAKSWMKQSCLGLKQLLLRHTDLFALEGDKGKQCVRLAQQPIFCPSPAEEFFTGTLDGFALEGPAEEFCTRTLDGFALEGPAEEFCIRTLDGFAALPPLPLPTLPCTQQIRLRGLPFQATEQDVWGFLHQPDCNAQLWAQGPEAVTIARRANGRSTGQATVTLLVPVPCALVSAHFHMRSMGGRYLEVLD